SRRRWRRRVRRTWHRRCSALGTTWPKSRKSRHHRRHQPPRRRAMGDPVSARWLVSFGTVAVAVMSSASAAHAQTDNRLAVGLSLTSRLANSSDASGSADVGFELRVGHKTAGWGQHYSLFNSCDTVVQPGLLPP